LQLVTKLHQREVFPLGNIHVRPRETLQGTETERTVLDQDRSIDLFRRKLIAREPKRLGGMEITNHVSCASSFLLGNLLDCSLNFRDFDYPIVYFYHMTKDSPHFGKLILVSSDEVEFCQAHFECTMSRIRCFLGWNWVKS